MPRRSQLSKLAALPKIVASEPVPLHPNYAANFQCISSACEDTCCNGWTIPIDHRTVRAYQAHPTLAPFAQLLILNNDNPSSGDYARMPLTHSGNCAFLNPDKLCGIHRHFGADLLSVACNTFPRETSYQFGPPETALNLACPEASRLTLLDPALLDPWRSHPLEAFTTFDSSPALAIRNLLIRIMLERSHSLSHRVHLLGELCQQIPSFDWAQTHPAEVVTLLQQTVLAATRPASRQSTSSSAELDFVTSVLAARVAEPPVPVRFRESLDECMAGLFPSGDVSAATHSIPEPPYLLTHPHLLENYLANHIVKYSYPFGHQGEQCPADAHLYLAGLHCLVHTLLSGSAAYHRKAFAAPHAIKLIQSFSRAIEHRSISRDEIVRLARVHHIGQPTPIHLVAARTSRHAHPSKDSGVLAIRSRKLALCHGRS